MQQSRLAQFGVCVAYRGWVGRGRCVCVCVAGGWLTGNKEIVVLIDT